MNPWPLLSAPLPADARQRLQTLATERIARARALRHYQAFAQEVARASAPGYVEHNARAQG